MELRQARDERDRQLSHVQALTEEVAKYKEYTGKSASELDCLTVKSNELEVFHVNNLSLLCEVLNCYCLLRFLLFNM